VPLREVRRGLRKRCRAGACHRTPIHALVMGNAGTSRKAGPPLNPPMSGACVGVRRQRERERPATALSPPQGAWRLPARAGPGAIHVCHRQAGAGRVPTGHGRWRERAQTGTGARGDARWRRGVRKRCRAVACHRTPIHALVMVNTGTCRKARTAPEPARARAAKFTPGVAEPAATSRLRPATWPAPVQGSPCLRNGKS